MYNDYCNRTKHEYRAWDKRLPYAQFEHKLFSLRLVPGFHLMNNMFYLMTTDKSNLKEKMKKKKKKNKNWFNKFWSIITFTHYTYSKVPRPVQALNLDFWMIVEHFTWTEEKTRQFVTNEHTKYQPNKRK